MPKVHFVKSARKDNSVVSKGEPYYWWKIKTGPVSGIKCVSKNRPRPSQLTRSSFYSAVYSAQESFEDQEFNAESCFETARDEVRDALQEILDETQEKLDNMPEGLQQGSTGELLQERINMLESAIGDTENVDIPDFDETDEEEGEDQDAYVENAIEEFVSAINDAFSSIG
jgi:hypothetical protein